MGLQVVSIDYRLNAFGFLGAAALRDTDGSVGNFGMQDQRAAMQWVQTHIHLFGGGEPPIACLVP
jgi:carboxylesterase type B